MDYAVAQVRDANGNANANTGYRQVGFWRLGCYPVAQYRTILPSQGPTFFVAAARLEEQLSYKIIIIIAILFVSI